MTVGDVPARPVTLGLRQNLAQFSLLVGVNALVGGMIGQERTVLPLLAEDEFGLTAFTATLTFIAAFGAVKAATNFFAGTLSDRYGRKPVLLVGWAFALPVPVLLMWAPSWSWVIAANVLLGVNQGLTWSTTVIMKIDLVGPERRGFAMGLNEAAGYGAVALAALATGAIAENAGLRPEPFYLGLVFAGLGLGLSLVFVRETHGHARHEAEAHPATDPGLATREVFLLTSFREKALSSCSQAGLVNNLNDGLAWGLFPIVFADAGLDVGRIGILAALYPAVWGLGQLITGGLSDRVGRKPLIATGMLTQAVAIGWIAATTGFLPWAAGAIVLGAGTAMVYPTLLAAIGDVAHPAWRARSVGVYRLWRDGGFAVGALLAGVVADVVSLDAAIWTVAALTAVSGLVVWVRMYETHPRSGDRPATAPAPVAGGPVGAPPGHMTIEERPPLLRHKSYGEPSVFTASSLLREGRRQRGLGSTPVPAVCLLDPDGDVVRHLVAVGAATRHEDWACYHSELWTTHHQGREIGIVACAVGGPYAVLVAEQLAESGCDLLVSVTSAGTIVPLGDPPYFVLVEQALRDDGTSTHYLPPGEWSVLAPRLATALDGAFDGLAEPVHVGRSWTTDAPYRETATAIEAARQQGVHAVEMEAAALYAYAEARDRDVVCIAHVTNAMAVDGDDFEKGEANGTHRILALATAIADRLRPRAT